MSRKNVNGSEVGWLFQSVIKATGTGSFSEWQVSRDYDSGSNRALALRAKARFDPRKADASAFFPADSAFAETAGRRFAAAMPSIVAKDRPPDQPMK